MAALQFCFSLPTRSTDFGAQIVLIKVLAYSPLSVHSHPPRQPAPTPHCPSSPGSSSSTPLSAFWSGFSWQPPKVMQVSHLTGADGSGLLFSKHGCVVGQILAHHLIIGEEEEIGLGTFNGLCVIPNCKGEKMAEKKASNPGYHEPPSVQSQHSSRQ